MKILKKHERHRPTVSVETGCRKNWWNVPLINKQEGERRRSIEHSNTHRRIYTLEFWSDVNASEQRRASGWAFLLLLSLSSALFTSLCSLFSSLLVTWHFNISYFNHFNFNLVFSGGLAWVEISLLSRARVHLIGLVRNETFITCQQKLTVWFSQRAPRHDGDERYRCFESSEGERRQLIDLTLLLCWRSAARQKHWYHRQLLKSLVSLFINQRPDNEFILSFVCFSS